MDKNKNSRLYFMIAIFVIVILNGLILVQLLTLRDIIDSMSRSISKLPELAEPIIINQQRR